MFYIYIKFQGKVSDVVEYFQVSTSNQDLKALSIPFKDTLGSPLGSLPRRRQEANGNLLNLFAGERLNLKNINLKCFPTDFTISEMLKLN